MPMIAAPPRTHRSILGAAAFLGAVAIGCSSNVPCEGTSCGGSGGSGGGDPLVVATDRGPVRGIVRDRTRTFTGIPYAAPPVGEARWRPPTPHAPWSEPLDATKKGHSCRQIDLVTGVFVPSSSEDCLTVNVWTPAVPPASPAPVLVWIHGGTFVTGSGGDIDFDGRALSQATGSVVVTLNYRLGPFGYLAYEPLAAEDPAHPTTGMYGFEDQRAALAWVKANIGAFGGDASNVTLFGESAGGISVCLHLVSPRSDGLFQRVIIESGPCVLNLGPTTEEAKAQGEDLASALGCSDPACLRAKSADDVYLALPPRAEFIGAQGSIWFPTRDGWNVPVEPAKAFDTNSFTKVPTLLGTNGDEGSLFFFGNTVVSNEADFQALMDRFFPGHGAAIVAHYPVASFKSAPAAASRAFGDGALVCPTRRLARAIAGAGVPTFRYDFQHVAGGGKMLGLGSYHASEIPFVFGNPTLLSVALTAPEQALSAEMQGYWSRFARAGDPNGDGAFVWPKYALPEESTLVLELELATEQAFDKDRCDFWDPLSPVSP